MLPAIRDLNVPVVLVNVQKKKAPDYEHTDTATWLGELYACGAVGEMVADLERAGKRHAVITGVVEGGDAYGAQEIDENSGVRQHRSEEDSVIPILHRSADRIRA